MPYPSSLDASTRRTPRMDRQVQRIIATLRQSPLTVPQLAEALFVSQHTAGNYIRRLYAAKRVYVSGWQPTEANKPTRIYSVGNLKDVEYITKRHRKCDTRAKDKMDILLGMLALPQTVKQLAFRSGVSLSRTRVLVADLKKDGKVYIKAWNQPQIKGSQAPVYEAGNKPDCVRLRRAIKKSRKKPVKANVLAFVMREVQAKTKPYATETEHKSCRAM